MTPARKRLKETADSDRMILYNGYTNVAKSTKASVTEQLLLPYVYATDLLAEYHIEINEMMEKDKKAFDHISVAIYARRFRRRVCPLSNSNGAKG